MPDEFSDMIGTKEPRTVLHPKPSQTPEPWDISMMIFRSSVTATTALLWLFLPSEERK